MMAASWLTAIILGLGLCISTTAAARNDRTIPSAIRHDVARALSDGGPLPPIPRGMVRPVDVNHDGTVDWLVDYAKAGEVIWCGTGGCRYKLFVSTGRDAFAVAFDESARSFRVARGGRVDADVYGAYCASFGADSCLRSFVWSSREGSCCPCMYLRNRRGCSARYPPS